MNYQRHALLSIGLPLLIITPLLALLIGCLYIPTFQQVDLKQSKLDYRNLLDNKSDKNAIVVGHANKQQVAMLLGQPALESRDGRRVWVYLVTTKQGIWVAPLCFDAAWADEKLHAVAFRFNSTDMLEHIQTVDEDYYKSLVFGYSSEEAAYSEALKRALTDISKENGLVPSDSLPMGYDYNLDYFNPGGH